MKIYIECGVLLNQMSGIGTFTKNLVEAYHKEYPNDQIVLFGFYPFGAHFNEPIPADATLHYRLVRWMPRRLYQILFKLHIQLPIDIMIGAHGSDTVLFPNFVSYPTYRKPKVYTFIHDLAFHEYPQYLSPANQRYLARFVPKTIKRSRILTISENTQKQLLSTYALQKETVSIVRPFPDHSYLGLAPETEVERVRQKYQLPQKYFLFIGNLEPRENIGGMLDAYALLPLHYRKEYAMVLAGGNSWLNSDMHNRISELNSDPDNTVITPGYIDTEDLSGLYTGAFAFVFVPHYEGFGMPPLEAMTCGTPVTCSHNSSLEEVVGNACLLVDETQPKKITEALTEILTNNTLRQDLIQRGYKQVKLFTPQRAAKELYTALRK